jgi:hypothetical protein
MMPDICCSAKVRLVAFIRPNTWPSIDAVEMPTRSRAMKPLATVLSPNDERHSVSLLPTATNEDE